MISTWFGKKPKAEDLDWIRNISRQCPRKTRVAIGWATSDLDLRSTFGEEGPPTLVLCGCRDQATPLKFSKAIAAEIANSELAVIDDAGHMVIIDDVASRLLAFAD